MWPYTTYKVYFKNGQLFFFVLVWVSVLITRPSPFMCFLPASRASRLHPPWGCANCTPTLRLLSLLHLKALQRAAFAKASNCQYQEKWIWTKALAAMPLLFLQKKDHSICLKEHENFQWLEYFSKTIYNSSEIIELILFNKQGFFTFKLLPYMKRANW